MFEPPISLIHLKYDPDKPHPYINGMDGCRVCGASWRHILHLTKEDTVTIDKTADVRPVKDPDEKLGDAIDEAIDEEGAEVKPGKLKSPTVEKTGDVKEKKDEARRMP